MTRSSRARSSTLRVAPLSSSRQPLAVRALRFAADGVDEAAAAAAAAAEAAAAGAAGAAAAAAAGPSVTLTNDTERLACGDAN